MISLENTQYRGARTLREGDILGTYLGSTPRENEYKASQSDRMPVLFDPRKSLLFSSSLFTFTVSDWRPSCFWGSESSQFTRKAPVDPFRPRKRSVM